ncbi:hypothetical protein V5O48_012225 [Marasmius crinis-equi]|uniref:Uncharacterized protein n=1 Tax=Marasmius crinis-equi TaxID=585013 RepID=A0ABR3F3E9_9AGAR
MDPQPHSISPLPLDFQMTPPDIPPILSPPHHLPSEPPVELRSSGLPAQNRQPPQQFRHEDFLPEAAPATTPDQNTSGSRLPRVRLIVRDTLRTICNSFGLYREYLHRPTHDPDSSVHVDELANYHMRGEDKPSSGDDTTNIMEDDSSEEPPWPFKSMTVYRYMKWLNTGSSSKTYGEADRLARIISSPDFDGNDLVGFRAKRESKRLDDAATNEKSKAYLNEFKKTSISIDIPSGQKDSPPQSFTVNDFYYRDLLETITSAFKNPLSLKFHLSPFKLFHVSADDQEPTRVYSELYNSDSFIQEHDRVQRAELPPGESCRRERVVAALMFWSDATQLANFGDAKLWPIYLFFGNLSKYIRATPSSGACHHIAYIPSLPDIFDDFARHVHAKWKTQQSDILTHCRRELMHAIWSFLLTDEFVHAYKYGIVIRCADGIERRVFPRIFTYSADYPEKVLLASIRDKGLCPCPRCLTPKASFWQMGMKLDTRFRLQNLRRYLLRTVLIARKYIYQFAYPIKGKHVEDLLKGISAVPTVNAFVSRLGESFDPCTMLVVDLMHEFELGVWKTLFTHLIRVLYASKDGSSLVEELNNRYRQISPFGSSQTIRRFSNNAADMKKLAARDFEDLLQCAIPVFEGLLPEPDNTQVLRLLYRAAEWHTLAKLRMHTDSTVEALQELSSELGRLLRGFRDSSAKLNTVELPREATARAKRQTAQNPNSTVSAGRMKKILNLAIYKFHALADYAPTVLCFGPTDGYSTQLGEMCHQQVKRYYRLGNKRDAARQTAQRYRRNALLRDSEIEDTKTVIPELHHQMSSRHDHSIHLRPWLFSNRRDPTSKDFLRKLKDHLLRRLLRRSFDGDTDEDFTDEERNSVEILGGKIYEVKTLRINYTTYDVRRDSDLINTGRDTSFIMLNSPIKEDSHPFWYARVMKVFHARVLRKDPASGCVVQGPQHMEFLWVRWLGVEPGYRDGRKFARLPKIGFVPAEDEMAFGFLEPDAVVRASHLIPQFSAGRTQDLLKTTGPTAARSPTECDDWVNYYVNIFVDRDMFMRYRGGGIGHRSAAQSSATESMDVDDEPEDSPDFDDIRARLQAVNEREDTWREDGFDGDAMVEDEEDEATTEDEADNDDTLDDVLEESGSDNEREGEDSDYDDL